MAKNIDCCGKTVTKTTVEETKYGNANCEIPAGTRLYIGGRYMLKFHDPIEWNAATTYEALEVVQHEGFSYISKKAVPANIPITNRDFWLVWADPNAQLEELRQLVEEISSQTESNTDDISDLKSFGGTIEVDQISQKGVYTLITLPKRKFRVDLDLISKNDLHPGAMLVHSETIPEFAMKNDYTLVSNVNNGSGVIYDHVLYGNDWEVSDTSRSSFFGTTDNGEPVMLRSGHFTDMMEIAKSAIGVWQVLRQNSVDVPTVEYATFTSPNPRQTFAWDDDNYYLFTVYSRFGEYVGMTFDEVRDFGKARGWQNIISFDGGGSNCVVMREPYTILAATVDNNRVWRQTYMVFTASER